MNVLLVLNILIKYFRLVRHLQPNICMECHPTQHLLPTEVVTKLGRFLIHTYIHRSLYIYGPYTVVFFSGHEQHPPPQKKKVQLRFRGKRQSYQTVNQQIPGQNTRMSRIPKPAVTQELHKSDSKFQSQECHVLNSKVKSEERYTQSSHDSSKYDDTNWLNAQFANRVLVYVYVLHREVSKPEDATRHKIQQ